MIGCPLGMDSAHWVVLLHFAERSVSNFSTKCIPTHIFDSGLERTLRKFENLRI
jgi:hypothetical protein